MRFEGTTVYLNASAKIEALAREHTAGDSVYTPSAPTTPDIHNLTAAELPELDSPEDIASRPMQTAARSMLGAVMHVARLRSDCLHGCVRNGKMMARPSERASANIKHLVYYLKAHPHVELALGGFEVRTPRRPR